VNPTDWKGRRRGRGEFERVIPNQDGAGVIAAVGDGVDEARVGERVWLWFAQWERAHGTAAELIALPQELAVPLPEGISLDVGAGLGIPAMTAHRCVFLGGPVQDAAVLVHGGAGAVGHAAIQLAVWGGARVAATVSSEEKAALARAAGADEVIVYSREDFVDGVRRITGGAGVHVVYDGVGATTFMKSLDCLRPRGLLALFGAASGPVPPVDLSILKLQGSLYITRPSLGAYVASREELAERAGDVLGWIRDGTLKLRVEHVFPLARAADAHRALERRQTTGKLVLEP